MPLDSSGITKKLPGNVGTCAHVLPTLDLLSSYATAEISPPCKILSFVIFVFVPRSRSGGLEI